MITGPAEYIPRIEIGKMEKRFVEFSFVMILYHILIAWFSLCRLLTIFLQLRD